MHASENRYADASRYVYSDKVSKRGTERTSGRAVSPILTAKQKPNAETIPLFADGIMMRNIVSGATGESMHPASIAACGTAHSDA